MSKAQVISVYFRNISEEVVESQRVCVERFLPEGWEFRQYLHIARGEAYPHAFALDKCVKENKSPLTVILDIDCIPIHENAFPILLALANVGSLTGAVQRANHIENNKHLYVGPFCMAFLNAYYEKFGCPSFKETPRGDCGEELTYRWQEEEWPIAFIFPTKVDTPLWDIDGKEKFGLGTVYGNIFYHHFNIRNTAMQQSFVKKCNLVLQGAAA